MREELSQISQKNEYELLFGRISCKIIHMGQDEKKKKKQTNKQTEGGLVEIHLTLCFDI